MTTAPGPNTGGPGQGKAAKRRRRRGRKPESAEDKAASSPEQKGSGSPARRRRKQGHKPKPPNPSPVERAERAAQTEAPSGPIDTETPLSRQELSEFKRRFAFLREYKKTLKLKLNAQEDLLLEGSREPDSRGVCHHLLSKVDYTTVQRAIERMPSADRPRLVGGVLDFRPELAFLLLYLESLKEAGHGDASRALEGALERIEWKAVSEGQMRRVLDLIVELFDANRRASLLLGLLESRSFKSALDQSVGKLPAALSDLILPVRALQAVVLEGKPNPASEQALDDGLAFALKSGLSTFEKRSERTRFRLLETLAVCAPKRLDENLGAALRLLGTFDEKSRERQKLELAFAHGFLALGREDRARKRLGELLRVWPNDAEANALDRALSAPRVGSFALLRGGASPPIEHLNPGLVLRSQRRVWLRVAKIDELVQLREHVQHHERLQLPAVARVLHCDGAGERAVVALERRGEPLLPNHPLLRERNTALEAALQITTFAAALATRALALPDLLPRRFEIAPESSQEVELRLVNTWQLEPVENAHATLLDLARRQALLERHLSREEQARLQGSDDFETLLARLDELRWA
jgi:hypothetical protein